MGKIYTLEDKSGITFWNEAFEEEMRKELSKSLTKIINEKTQKFMDPCTFCSVRMFGTGTYTDKKGNTVYVDYIKKEDVDDFCRKHCEVKGKMLQRKIDRILQEMTNKKKRIILKNFN